MSLLRDALVEIELHASQAGWDQPAQLFALVDTADLIQREPQLAEVLGIDGTAVGLTPVEQDPIPADQQVEDVLATISWPDEVTGCAAVLERVVLPPEADVTLPEDRDEAIAFAAGHPDRQEVRIVAGAIRGGESFCVVRLRSHDDPAEVMGGPDVVPGLLQLLHATLDPDHHAPSGDTTHDE